MSSTLYKSGEKVFAKVRGYPFWPARIDACADETPNKVKYHVYFYGTAETAICKAEEVVPYMENREKYGKPLKRKGFNEGLAQIQREINGGVPDSEPYTRHIEGDVETGAGADSDDGSSASAPSSARPALTNVSIEKKQKLLAAIKRKRESMDSVNEDSSSEVKRKHPRLSMGSTSGGGTPGGKAPSTDGDSPPNKAKAVSRSGRKLKRKKFADDEADGDLSTDETSVTTSTGGVPPEPGSVPSVSPLIPATSADTPSNRVRKSQGTPRSSELSTHPSPDESAKTAGEAEVGVPGKKSNRVILARALTGHYVQIRLDDDRPAVFQNEKARLMWEAATARNAERLKAQIELGEFLPDAIKKQLEGKTDLTEAQKKEMKKESELQRKRGKLRWLKQEAYLLELDSQIRSCLSLAKADTQRCLQLMDDMINVNIDPLMLKKHPTIVDTIKKLQRYIGNVSKWGMSDDEVEKFNTSCEQIRQKATHMYHKFKKLFAVPSNKTFWDVFTQEVEKFNEVVKNMPRDKMYALVVDPEHHKEMGSSDEEDSQEPATKKTGNTKSPKVKRTQSPPLDSKQHKSSVDTAQPVLAS